MYTLAYNQKFLISLALISGLFICMSTSLGIYNIVYSIAHMEQIDHYSTSADTEQTPDPRDSAVITLQRHGTANEVLPVYSLTIYGNGNVIYNGINNVNTSGIQTYQIPRDRASELVNEFINIYYFALKDKYIDSSNASSTLMVTTSINLNGKTKTVLDDHSAYAPSTLRALENKIDQFTNSKQWIESGSIGSSHQPQIN